MSLIHLQQLKPNVFRVTRTATSITPLGYILPNKEKTDYIFTLNVDSLLGLSRPIMEEILQSMELVYLNHVLPNAQLGVKPEEVPPAIDYTPNLTPYMEPKK